MTELELYKFIINNKSEYQWVDDDVLLFIYFQEMNDWCNLLGRNIFDDDGIKTTMKYGYFCFWMFSICEFYDIDMNKIFNKDENRH